MPDLSHLWGEDLSFSDAGDLATVDGTDLGTQSIIRRLMTRAQEAATAAGPAVSGELVFHQAYGAGVPSRVGRTIDVPLITSVVRSQIMAESTVARTPAPIINVAAFLNGVSVSVRYNDAITGRQASLSFDVNG